MNSLKLQLFSAYQRVYWLSVSGGSEHATEAEYSKASDAGTQMVSYYPTACHVFRGEPPTAEREDFNLNNACHDTNIPEVTLLIMIKHLPGVRV